MLTLRSMKARDLSLSTLAYRLAARKLSELEPQGITQPCPARDRGLSGTHGKLVCEDQRPERLARRRSSGDRAGIAFGLLVSAHRSRRLSNRLLPGPCSLCYNSIWSRGAVGFSLASRSLPLFPSLQVFSRSRHAFGDDTLPLTS
jgi:hypothetical protein